MVINGSLLFYIWLYSSRYFSIWIICEAKEQRGFWYLHRRGASDVLIPRHNVLRVCPQGSSYPDMSCGVQTRTNIGGASLQGREDRPYRYLSLGETRKKEYSRPAKVKERPPCDREWMVSPSDNCVSSKDLLRVCAGELSGLTCPGSAAFPLHVGVAAGRTPLARRKWKPIG